MDLRARTVASLDKDRCVESQFDYGAYEAPVGKFLKSQAERIRQYVRSSTIQIGKDLIAGKRYLSHGEFHLWVIREVGIPIRTAQAYMQVAQWASGKKASITSLPPSLLYALSARSTPKEFSEIVIQKIEAGEQVTPLFIREQLSVLRGMKRIGIADASKVALENSEPPINDNACRYAIQEAIAIISLGLRAADFARVKAILTDDLVLRDPMLNMKLAIAFDAVLSEAYMPSLHDIAYAPSASPGVPQLADAG